MIVDCHLHTPFCGHADGDPIEYVETAARRGIDLVAFTCHIPLQAAGFGDGDTRMSPEDLPAYIAAVQASAVRGRSLGVEVQCGIEAEIFPDDAITQLIAETLGRHSFDFVVGSLHYDLPGYRKWLRERELQSQDQIIDAYFRHLRRGVESGLFHSIGHANRIASHRDIGDSGRYLDHRAVIMSFLETAAERGVCVELNTNEGTSHRGFDARFLEWACQSGVRFTLGSDAHKPKFVGRNIDAIVRALRKYGIERAYHFRRGVAHSYAPTSSHSKQGASVQ